MLNNKVDSLEIILYYNIDHIYTIQRLTVHPDVLFLFNQRFKII